MTKFDSWVVIIVNLNLKDDTTECIKSIVFAGMSIEKIIVVDNGSNDGSIEHLRTKFGEGLNIIDAEVNKGYAYALNLGIKRGIDLGSRWFFLMNNDTVVDVKFFDKLSDAIQTDSIIGLYGPLIFYYSQPELVWYLGDKLIPGTLITINPYRGKKTPIYKTKIVPVDFVHGCGMLVRRDVIENVGPFDDSSLIYGEEIDFIWRARLAGYKAVGVPAAKMWHKISAIMGKQKPKTRYLRIRNQIKFYRKYSQGISYLTMFIFSTFRCLFLGVKDLLQGDVDLLKPTFDGWYGGWFSKGISGDK